MIDKHYEYLNIVFVSILYGESNALTFFFSTNVFQD